MKILILGADGYLGWSMTASLAKDNHELILVDNYSKRKYMEDLKRKPLYKMPLVPQRLKNLKKTNKKIIFYKTDCSDYKKMKAIITKHKPDAVIHFAELPSAPFSMLNNKYGWETLQNNLQSTFNLIHCIKDIIPDCHIIKLGTMGEYGTPNIDIEEGWLNINHNNRKDKFLYPRQGSSLYHMSKIMDTDLIWFYVRNYDLNVTDLMQGPVYGIYHDEFEKEDILAPTFTYDDIFGTVLNRFIVQAVAETPLTVYGSGAQIRGYINVVDTIKCIKLTLKNRPQNGELAIYNQFTEQFSVRQLAQLVKKSLKAININATISNIANPRIEKEKHYYNAKNSNIEKLGLKPLKLSPKVIIDIAKYVNKHKDRIDKRIIKPKVNW
ncbi:MAG: NAD-dependent epimerase/dehydratase family protein [Gammaproteobacteria bacterium]|nr:NAD-dependent epimerase/dehydratase family protein [Gammaproteobacteria bacterium]